MKTGDIYINILPDFPAPLNDYSRLCVIRSCTDDKVTFSVSADNQPMIDKGVYFFTRDIFTISRSVFLSGCAPYRIFDSTTIMGEKYL